MTRPTDAGGALIRLEKQADGRYLLSGELTARSVVRVLKLLPVEAERQAGGIHVDLAGVSHSDSSGLALLLEWLRLARRQGVDIRFRHLPAQMVDLARISDLLPLLPVE